VCIIVYDGADLRRQIDTVVGGTVISMEETIRTVLAEYAKLMVDASTIDVDDNLYTLGLTSHASVNVMLALEDAFDVEFPDADLRKDTFGSIASISNALSRLGAVTVT
jgi:acyl carrier protein